MSWSKTLRLAALAALLAAAGCGFHPLYGERSASSVAAPELASVQIDLIHNREGQLVRNSLLDKMRPRGGAGRDLYRLTVNLNVIRENLGIRTDETATRGNLTMSASYSLINLADGKVLMTSNSRAVSSYNILESDYATQVSDNDAVRRTAADLAEEIKTRVAVFLSSRKAG